MRREGRALSPGGSDDPVGGHGEGALLVHLGESNIDLDRVEVAVLIAPRAVERGGLVVVDREGDVVELGRVAIC